jgi:hypothetical protein
VGWRGASHGRGYAILAIKTNQRGAFMDPVTAGWIVSALVLGAKFVFSAVAEEEVQAKYRDLKQFLSNRFRLSSEIDRLEEGIRKKKGISEAKKESLTEDLVDATDGIEGTLEAKEQVINELLQMTKSLTASLATLPKETFDAVGMSLEDDAVAINANIGNVIAEGGGRAAGMTMKGKSRSEGTRINSVHATGLDSSTPKS